MNPSSSDWQALKARLRATWMAGDFGQIAQHFTADAAAFVDRLHLAPGQSVLDLACGTGNQSIPAARAGAIVTGLDLAPNLVDQARLRASEAGLSIQFDEGDAEHLTYPDASFDVILSMFGVMFTPSPEQVVAEMIRVCRPGGRIAMGNWTPQGFIGQVFKCTGRHVPPAPGIPSPILWGDRETVRQRLTGKLTDLEMKEQTVLFEFPTSPADTVEYFRLYYGPTQRAFAALDEAGQANLRHDLEQLWIGANRATDGTTKIESEYLEIVGTR